MGEQEDQQYSCPAVVEQVQWDNHGFPALAQIHTQGMDLQDRNTSTYNLTERQD